MAVSRFLPLALAALLCSCYSRTAVLAPSPEGHRTVRVREICLFPDCLIYVDAEDGIWRRRLCSVSDSVLGFVEVAWSVDSTQAGALVDRGTGPPILTGYDFAHQRVLPAEVVWPVVRATIQRRYPSIADSLNRYGQNPNEWVSRFGSQMAPERTTRSEFVPLRLTPLPVYAGFTSAK